MGPFGDEGIGIGEQDGPVAAAPEFQQFVQVALGNVEDVALPGVSALFRSEFPAGEPAQFFPEGPAGDPAAFQVAEKTGLDAGIEQVAGIGDADFLEAADRLFIAQGEDDASHVEYQIADHGREDTHFPYKNLPFRQKTITL